MPPSTALSYKISGGGRNRRALFKAKSPRALQGEIAARSSRRNRRALFKANEIAVNVQRSTRRKGGVVGRRDAAPGLTATCSLQKSNVLVPCTECSRIVWHFFVTENPAPGPHRWPQGIMLGASSRKKSRKLGGPQSMASGTPKKGTPRGAHSSRARPLAVVDLWLTCPSTTRGTTTRGLRDRACFGRSARRAPRCGSLTVSRSRAGARRPTRE